MENQLKMDSALGISSSIKGLEEFSGEWTKQLAAHLLKRTTFGPTYPEIKEIYEMGLKAAIEELFKERPLPSPPLNDSDEKDTVPIGQTWVDTPTPRDSRFRRRRSMLSWTVINMVEEKNSIREKMTLFWHNHFSIESGIVNDARFLYQYQMLLRTNALGNFKDLVKNVTIDPTMLRYLDGRNNRKNKPNENYARELLELFTIGKGPIVAPGDYTHYTEDDIIAIAKVLTGWRDYGYNSDEIATPYAEFRPQDHDTSIKQLSHRFNEVFIPNGEEQEYEMLINIIFTKVEVAYFICRKLYRWFVNFEISDEVEDKIIKPLGALFVASEFEVKPVLKALLSSQHFFDAQYCGAVIKNPMDYTVGFLRQAMVSFPDELERNYLSFWRLHQLLETTQMAYFGPPNVAGWPAYYQTPIFYQSWINTSTLAPRTEFAEGISSERGWNNVRLKADVFAMVESLDNPSDPNLLIEGLGLMFYPVPLVENQTNFLKDILIPGLPDFEWTIEYNKYLSDPSDENLKKSVEQRLLNLLRAMVLMPEVYLS